MRLPDPSWNDPKAPDRFRKNISKKWSEDTVQFFEKFIDREQYLQQALSHINRFIPEIKTGGYSILDMSCGSGAMLEVARMYGNDIQGTDEPFCVYLPLLKSQNIPYLPVDGSNLPYPFEDNSFDIVASMHAIFFFSIDKWVDIVRDLCRISRKKVLVISTSRRDKPEFDEGNEILAKLDSPLPGWKMTQSHLDSYFTWERNNGY